MKRNRIISILIIWTLMISLLPAPAALAAEDYWICPRCEKRVRESVGDICPYCGYERHVHGWTPATCVAPKTCKTCGETEGDPDPANHPGETEIRGQKTAGCTKAGYTGDVHCAACGQLLEKGREIPAEGHRWEAGDILQEATCITPGLQEFTCANCGLTLEMETELDPTAHTGGTELRDKRPATCGEAGYTGDTYCLDCGVKILTGRVVRATGKHDWQAATCTEPKTCKVCGATDGEPLGHQWDEGAIQYPATCRIEGVAIYTCRTCGLERTEILPVNPEGHTWNEGEVIYPATCAKVGLKRYTCTACGKTKPEVIPLDPERHEGKTEIRDDREPSCAEAGYTGDVYCTACGEKLSDGEQIPVIAHRWDEGTVLRAAGCRSTGVTVYHCRGCGQDKRVLVLPDPANHMGGREIRNARPATCGEDGYTGDAWCRSCGQKISDGSVIPATGKHSWEAATCTEPKTCKVCGAVEGEANGHDWQAATCTEPKTCKVCGAVEGEANGHDWQAATCTEPKTCKVCGAIEGEGKGHDWQAATCTEPKTCKVCGETEGEALGHDWQAATCTEPKTCKVCRATEGKALGHDWQEATCTEPKTCKVCGETEGEALGHDWQAATCTEPKACKVCGMIEGEALGHDWQAATCAEPKTCKVCGIKEGEPVGHQWDEGTVFYPATCRVEGLAVYTCQTCGEERTEFLPVNPEGHTWNEGEIIYPATCVKVGMMRYTCTACGATKPDVIPIDPEHHEGKTEIRGKKEPSCAETGYTGDTYCTACGKLTQAGETIPAKNHDWQAATCTAPKTCRVCGATEGMPAGHAWNQGEIVREATCIATGIIRYSCTVCGETKEDILPINPGHHTSGQETRNAVGAACEADGYTGDAYCTACGAKITEGSIIPATGHDWQAATTTAPKTCRVCGKTEGKPLLSAVTGLKSIKKTIASITIGWDAMPGTEYYSVYQRKTGEKSWTTKNSQVSGTEYTFTNLKANTEYDFRVIVHADGQQSNGMILKGVKTKKRVAVGDTVTFGTYPQTESGTDNTPIEWLVLEYDAKNNRALLISRYGLDAQPYNTERKDITWEESSVRRWLNSTFMNKAFSAKEQSAIVQVNVDNSKSQGYSKWSTSGGNNTQDRIYLLSYAEANKYFGVTYEDSKNTKSRVTPTAYAKKEGAYTNGSYKTTEGKAAGWWWLRSPGYYQNYAAYVCTGGSLDYRTVNSDSGCVRPALWINLESDIF